MTNIDKRTVSLPPEHAAYIDRLVQERDAAMEMWLQEDVAAMFDAMKADGRRARPADAISTEIRARHTARLSLSAGVI